MNVGLKVITVTLVWECSCVIMGIYWKQNETKNIRCKKNRLDDWNLQKKKLDRLFVVWKQNALLHKHHSRLQSPRGFLNCSYDSTVEQKIVGSGKRMIMIVFVSCFCACVRAVYALPIGQCKMTRNKILTSAPVTWTALWINFSQTVNCIKWFSYLIGAGKS